MSLNRKTYFSMKTSNSNGLPFFRKQSNSAQVVLLREVELEPGVKVECVSKFCYLGDRLGSCGV